MLAAIRGDAVNLAVLVHVVGAMALVGALVTAGTAGLVGWRGELALRRLSYKTLLLVALPGYIVMRIGAEWAFAKENVDDVLEDEAWIGIGYITADIGALLLVIALILGGIGLRRSRTGGGGALLKTTTVLSLLLVAFYVVAVWAMGAKPS